MKIQRLPNPQQYRLKFLTYEARWNKERNLSWGHNKAELFWFNLKEKTLNEWKEAFPDDCFPDIHY